MKSVESFKKGGRPLKLAALTQFPFALKGNLWCQSSKRDAAKLYSYPEFHANRPNDSVLTTLHARAERGNYDDILFAVKDR